MSKIQVWGCKGCGSVIAEAFLTLANIPFEHEEIDYSENTPRQKKLLQLNPLGQVPTLVMPDGSILTETLAVAAYADSKSDEVKLIPKKSPELEIFWRWATFIIAAIYPTYTYGDTPTKWVADSEAAKSLRTSTDEWRQKLWLQFEKEVQTPYFLGSTFSAIDIYIAAMSNWRPWHEWFVSHTPRMMKVAERVVQDPRLKELWRANFS